MILDRATTVGIATRLATAGVPSPEADAQQLITAAADAVQLEEWVTQRLLRVPLQHLTGRAYFRHLELHVGPGVFIPRPETELVAQAAIDLLATLSPSVAVDLCAGSGAVAIAVATEVPGAVVHAVEQSADALTYLRRNVTAYAAAVDVVAGDATDPSLLPHLTGTVDVVTANPPYIPDTMVPREPEVRDHDPDVALYGGPDGLDVARGVVSTAARLLRPGSLLVMEHADVQGESVLRLFGAEWTQVVEHNDYNGLPRYVTARKMVE